MERLSSVSTVPLQFYMPSCIIFQYFSNLLGSFFSLPIILLHASRLFPHRLRERCKRGNTKKTGNKPKQRNKKKAKKESSGESGQKKVDEKEEEAATLTNSASSSPNPPIDNEKKKGRGSR